MVLDVTRWLPEHPGGSTIIPRQALNLDAALFFELYHASRESFLFLKEFYIGACARRVLHTRRKRRRRTPAAARAPTAGPAPILLCPP